MKEAQLHPTRNPNHKVRRIRSHAFSSSSFSKLRLTRNASSSAAAAAAAKKKNAVGPTTSLPKWKLAAAAAAAADEPGKGSTRKNAVRVSARKLAAGIWHANEGLGFEPNVDPHSSSLHSNRKRDHYSSHLMNYPKNGTLHKLESPAYLDPSMERATKWDPGFYTHVKLLNDQHVTTVSDLSPLRAELEEAHRRIAELETERHAAQNKLDHFFRKLADEKEAWRRRTHEKIRIVIDSIKEDLHRERKTRQRMEIVNSKLVNELAEAKLSAKRFLQDYEKERKTRELMEEVCDELAKEIGDDKAEVEALKVESMKAREEVEEERKMLQMAEVWREERVQMKLVDAKVTLEEKYSQLSKLQSEVEVFLKARSNSIPNDEEEKREAELLRDAANSVKGEEMKEFSYQPPPASEDIFSIFEELQPREEPNEREIKADYGCPDKPNVDDDSGWETVSHAEEQGSSSSIEGSDTSVNGMCEESNASVSGTDWDENGDNRNLNSEISEVCSVTTKQSRKKGSSIGRFWRSSYSTNGGNCQKYSFEVTNGRLSNGRVSNGTLSPDGKSGEAGLSSPSVRQCSSPDLVNPHVTRGMKGCIEWPRGMQKQSLKAKLLEARMESQKIPLRQALQQKI